MSKGKIYLIPNLLGDSSVDKNIPKDVQKITSELRYFIVENIKIARRYLRKIDREFPIDDSSFFELNKHTNPNEISDFLEPVEKGFDIGIISDAGCPGIADPGADVVKIAHQKNIQIVPLIGPSSILLALMSSGLNGQNFSFNGYLPKERNDKKKAIKYLEMKSKTSAQIFMDTPFRNMNLLEDVLNSCDDNTLLCIACDITLDSEYIRTKTIAYWKKNIPNLNKRPCLFILGN